MWIFLAGLWKKQKRNTPWSRRGTLSSGEWVTLSSFVRILPTNASQFVLWRELLRFMERKDGCLLAWCRTWAPSTTALATVCLGSCSDLVFAANWGSESLREERWILTFWFFSKLILLIILIRILFLFSNYVFCFWWSGLFWLKNLKMQGNITGKNSNCTNYEH